MIDVRKGLFAYLMDDASISVMIAGTHLYPNRIPQGIIKDSITYQRISGLGDIHMRGPSGLSRPRIQIDCWSPSADRAQQMADAVKERLNGFRGSMPWGEESPQQVVVVQGVFYENERDLFDDSVGMYSLSRDYVFWYIEKLPAGYVPPPVDPPPIDPPIDPPLPAGGPVGWDGDALKWDGDPVVWD